MSLSAESLPQIRFDITEASRILRMSRATLYERVRLGEIKTQKDGRRSYITAEELQRYVKSCPVWWCTKGSFEILTVSSKP